MSDYRANSIESLREAIAAALADGGGKILIVPGAYELPHDDLGNVLASLTLPFPASAPPDCAREVDLIDLLVRARSCAEWHLEDGDECGVFARRVIADLNLLLLSIATAEDIAARRAALDLE